ncbi:MAG: transcription-repair coupling factor (superfamily II helicase), partial [Marinoscillum sp.]
MGSKEILSFYCKSDLIKSVVQSIGENKRIRLKGLSGSFDSIIAAATSALSKNHNIYILHDKEEAAYFLNDLRNFSDPDEILLFPSSYKKPYQFEETENANVL